MKISENEAQEIKKSAENIYRLTKLILTERRKEYSQINIPKGQNAIAYRNNKEKYERPELYYHYQDLDYYCEIRRGKNDYYVKTNIKAPKRILIDETKEVVKPSGYINTYEYRHELFEIAENNYREITAYIINKIKDRHNNVLMFE